MTAANRYCEVCHRQFDATDSEAIASCAVVSEDGRVQAELVFRGRRTPGANGISGICISCALQMLDDLIRPLGVALTRATDRVHVHASHPLHREVRLA